MKSSRLSSVMPARAGIHVFSCGRSARKTWMAGTSPAMTPNKWLNATGTSAERKLQLTHYHQLLTLCSVPALLLPRSGGRQPQ